MINIGIVVSLRKNLYAELNVHNRSQAVVKAINLSLIDLTDIVISDG